MKKIFYILLIFLTGNAVAHEPQGLSDNELGYFVSFSIPETQLVTLIRTAEKRSIPVYLNGLVNNTIEDTAKVIMYLSLKYGIQGVLIDPIRFDYYGIKSVPALVKKCGQNFDVVFGNLDIEQSLELIKSEGDCR